MSLINDKKYLDQSAEWDELATRLRGAGLFGYDSEFYGVRVDEESCVGRAVVHVWSVAIRTRRMDPLGFHHCRGWCLPAAALTHPSLLAVLEDPAVRKDIHNEPVDRHASDNMGVRIRGARNTLGLLRWKMPWLIALPGRFALKPNMQRLLHREPVCTYKQLVSWERLEMKSTWHKRVCTVNECSCGVEGCRKRKGHTKFQRAWTEDYETVREVKVAGEYPLQEIVPGHPRFPLLVDYAIDDAVAAVQIGELADAEPDPCPFPFAPHRPTFSQEVEEAVIEMEAAGLPVDVEFCRVTADRAIADEECELRWLFRWYVVNAPTEGPHRRDEVDAVWSSPKKKIELFDALGFPRSPIWAKGRVKPGKVKLDHAAMKWIGRDRPDCKQLMDHLLQLQRVRSNKKYLIKLRDSGGTVHPICGPAGDDDDRSGAVTGRLGVKGEFEAQQLPTRDEVDLYKLRKAIAICQSTNMSVLSAA